MPDERTEAMLKLIAKVADDYYTTQGHYPSRLRVGTTVGGFFLKAGEHQARIALRPGSTTLWITLIVDYGLHPMDIVAESRVPDVPNQLGAVIAFCSKRYNQNRDRMPALAKAHLAIINRANDVMLTTGNLDDLLEWLNKPHGYAALTMAAKEVLEHFGAAPGKA